MTVTIVTLTKIVKKMMLPLDHSPQHADLLSVPVRQRYRSRDHLEHQRCPRVPVLGLPRCRKDLHRNRVDDHQDLHPRNLLLLRHRSFQV